MYSRSKLALNSSFPNQESEKKIKIKKEEIGYLFIEEPCLVYNKHDTPC